MPSIWYYDLRNSTKMTASMPAEDYLDLLNAYFECTAGAVLAHGGEVLRFIGDAVLAIFPIGDGTSGIVARRHWPPPMKRNGERTRPPRNGRARGRRPSISAWRSTWGDVMFGNIGVPERLEFSVIGPAANEVGPPWRT